MLIVDISGIVDHHELSCLFKSMQYVLILKYISDSISRFYPATIVVSVPCYDLYLICRAFLRFIKWGKRWLLFLLTLDEVLTITV
jgi:hypothetical protein